MFATRINFFIITIIIKVSSFWGHTIKIQFNDYTSMICLPKLILLNVFVLLPKHVVQKHRKDMLHANYSTLMLLTIRMHATTVATEYCKRQWTGTFISRSIVRTCPRIVLNTTIFNNHSFCYRYGECVKRNQLALFT